MKKTFFLTLFLSVVVVVFSLFMPAFSEEKYPSKPVHLIVPMTAGGGTDRVARALAESLKNHLPQPVLVETYLEQEA
jgi:tripartite-type tricarboxylate transporter receptor subunit TctC